MPPTLELATTDPEQTRTVGEAVSALLRAGDVVSLTGDLGAGKTTFVQGAARGLGVVQPVLSPTFTLVREYHGARLGTGTLYHLDVYRLDRLQDVLELGFEEMLDEGGVVFIEWGDAIDALLPERHLQVELSLPDGDDDARLLALTATGASWAERWDALVESTARWWT